MSPNDHGRFGAANEPHAHHERDEHDEMVRRSFERQVGLFSGPDSPFARREPGALAWLEPLTADMVVLDVACGAAHVAEVVAPHVRQVVGIDLTPSLLNLGAARLRDAGVSNVLLQEGNAHALPFVDGSFDIVCCRAALHHLADPQQAVAEMVRACRPGGRVVLSDLIAPSLAARNTFDRLHRLIDPSHFHAFVEDELAHVLPGTLTLTYGETGTFRLPIDVSLTEQSDRDAVFAADLVPTTAHLDSPWIMGYDLYPMDTLAAKQAFARDAIAKEILVFFEHDPVTPAGYIRENNGTRSVERADGND
jgi:ubiquinone/menaquinone biosynthesis C-methylase UbiE